MIVGVPVAYATPQYWNESKRFLWIGSMPGLPAVFLVGAFGCLSPFLLPIAVIPPSVSVAYLT